jgi:hypothetical protein
MNRLSTYMLAAAIAVSGTSLFAADATDTGGVNSAAAQLDRSADRAGDRLQRMGSTQADEATSREARMALARLVNDALTPDHFNNLTRTLAQSDQDRFSKSSNVTTDDLDRVIRQFRQDFRAKYGQEFDAKAEAFNDTLVYGGQDNKSVTVAVNDIAAGHAALNSSGSPMAGGSSSMNTSSNMSGAAINTGNINHDASDNTLTGRAASDRKFDTSANIDTQSNRNGALSASDTSSTTLGNRTGPASSGNNSNSVVRGNDVTANPGVAASSGTYTAGGSGTSINSAGNTAAHDQNLAANVNRDASDNTLTGRAASDRQLNANDATLSNRNGALSASDTSSTTLGNRTGPASSGNNSNSVVRGNDVTANPGVAAGNNSAAEGAHMTTSNDISRSAVGTDVAGNSRTNTAAGSAMDGSGASGAAADRSLATSDMTQSNRNGALSASDTSSPTLGNRTGPASSGNNSNSVVRGNDVTANPGINPSNTSSNAAAGTVTREDLAVNNTTPASGQAVMLHLVNEGGAVKAWHFDVADQFSAQGLKDNLVRHIQMLDDQKSTWPSDVNDAYKTAAYHVLQAFNDTSIASER